MAAEPERLTCVLPIDCDHLGERTASAAYILTLKVSYDCRPAPQHVMSWHLGQIGRGAVHVSCVTCLDPLAHAAPRNIALRLYRIVSLCHDACPPVVSPVFSSLGSLVSCFGRVCSGLSRRVPRCARRGPVSSLPLSRVEVR